MAGGLAVGGLVGCSPAGQLVAPGSDTVRRVEDARRVDGRRIVSAGLTPQSTTLDLGGRTVPTWAYGDALPGPRIRATAGDLLPVEASNRLDTSTSVHWHGLALRNDMDGVPGITQDPMAAGASFIYEFTARSRATYFYHPHSGMQLEARHGGAKPMPTMHSLELPMSPLSARPPAAARPPASAPSWRRRGRLRQPRSVPCWVWCRTSLHHVGILVGAAPLTGVGGNLLFGLLGLLLSLPLLRRLYRRFRTWKAPAIALVIFAFMYALSAFVIGPAISSDTPPTPAPAASPAPTPTGHSTHHGG